MQNLIHNIFSNNLYTIITIAILAFILFAIVKKLIKFVIYALVAFVAFLVYVHLTGKSAEQVLKDTQKNGVELIEEGKDKIDKLEQIEKNRR